MYPIVAIIISYLIGSVIFSVPVGMLIKGIDIRRYGSGNAGATNSLRVLGIVPALIVLILDLAKGVAAVWLGKWLAPDLAWVAFACGVSAVIGHSWPIFFRFRGGKGIATTAGVVATMGFLPSFIAALLAFAIVFVTRYVSLGSILFVTLLPIMFVIFQAPSYYIWFSLALIAIIVYRHRTNIVKIIQRREHKIGSKL